MSISVDVMGAIVTDASTKMTDPNFASVLVGGFAERQPAITQYLSAHDAELEGADGVIRVVFHCALVDEAVKKAIGRYARTLSFSHLDDATKVTATAFAKREPAVSEFVTSNLQGAAQGICLTVAVALTA